MPTIPGPVDSDGNITVPTSGGVIIPIKEQSNDVPPVQLDISSYPLSFEVKGRFTLTPDADPNDIKGRLITITEAMAQQLSTKEQHFALLDISTPSVPIPLWEGTIKRAS